jgi:UDP-N-acetylglucosamine--N-acetylmuramyl-(pentapeptide) pyrophosphoryl-undecaprenol N-acetylglucosamine transferase
MSKKRVFITGGGTGGHIYPAIAIYEELLKFLPKEDIFYVGNPKNLEKRVTSSYEINFLDVCVSGMPRALTFKFISWSFELFISIFVSIYYILKYRPDFIIGTGGYVSFPVLIAGVLFGIPCYIHDSDAYPGIVSRIIAPFAKCVFLAFEDAKKRIKAKKIIINGNPLRNFDIGLSKKQAIEHLGLDLGKKTLFVMGGSQGAKTINKAVLALSEELTSKYNLQIIHQTGAKNFDEAQNLMPGGLSGYILKPYFDDMSIPYSACDFVIARSGSISLSELNNCGLGAVLVPYPHAAANHQFYNAKAVEKQCAAVVLEDKDCSPENLLEIILSIIQNEEKLKQMSENSLKLAKPDATKNLVEILLEDN